MTNLEPVPEDWNSALAVVAHPDDLEYGAASAIARWTSQGKAVSYCMVTSGAAGIGSVPPADCKPLREEEERRSAAVVGVSDVEFLGFPDGQLEANSDLRRALCESIRRHRPDVVIGMNFRESFFGGFGFNQADHVACGLALVHAVRDAANRWLFPEVGDEAWAGVKFAIFGASERSAHGVDVGEHMDVAVESLLQHQAYLDGLGDNPMGTDPDGFLRQGAEHAGSLMGVRYAQPFELIVP